MFAPFAEQSVVLPVFGLGLQEHLDNSGREIAVVIEDCIMALYSPDYNGLQEEVIYILYFKGTFCYLKLCE
jgi:hypothetical protein